MSQENRVPIKQKKMHENKKRSSSLVLVQHDKNYFVIIVSASWPAFSIKENADIEEILRAIYVISLEEAGITLIEGDA